MARGIVTRTDVLATTTDGRPLDALYEEFIATLDIYNKARDPLSALFTFPTTDASEAVPQTGELAEFEAASEFGAPKSLRSGPTPLMMGFPLEWFDGSIRYTEAFLRDASARQVEAQHAAALEAGNRLTFRAVFRALMTKTTLGNRATNEAGVPIYALWDGSTDSTPPNFAGKSFSSGHTHYLTTGSAQVDGIDLQVLIRTVAEHGYGVGPGEKIVLLVHPTQGESIRALRAGADSPYDFIPSQGAPAYLTKDTIVGDRAPGEFANLPVAGSYGEALVIESYYAQPGYVTCVAVSGGARNALAYRVHPRPEYQGLRLKPTTTVGPYLLDATYSNGFGVAVRNRGAAAVMQVTTSSEYTSPVI